MLGSWAGADHGLGGHAGCLHSHDRTSEEALAVPAHRLKPPPWSLNARTMDWGTVNRSWMEKYGLGEVLPVRVHRPVRLRRH